MLIVFVYHVYVLLSFINFVILRQGYVKYSVYLNIRHNNACLGNPYQSILVRL